MSWTLKVVTLFAVGFVLTGAQSNSLPAGYRITFERSECYGTCPSYRLEIDAKGHVKFEGRKYCKSPSQRTRQLTEQALAQLAAKIEDADFFSLDNSYRAAPTDAATVTLTITAGKRKKTIRHYGPRIMGDNAPEKLVVLEESIDKLVNIDEWLIAPERRLQLDGE